VSLQHFYSIVAALPMKLPGGLGWNSNPLIDLHQELVAAEHP